MFLGNKIQLPISLALRSNSSEDKSGMWVGSTKKDWNLTSSMKMSPFRVKYEYHIMKNTRRQSLWRVLYLSIKGTVARSDLLALFIHYTSSTHMPCTYNHSLLQFYTMAPLIMQTTVEGALSDLHLMTSWYEISPNWLVKHLAAFDWLMIYNITIG